MVDGFQGPLDLVGPARHAATEMERADQALSIEELAVGYRHMNTGDLARVKRQQGYTKDHEANVWLIRQALEELERRGKNGAVQLVEADGKWRFDDGVGFDDLWFNSRKLQRIDDSRSEWGDPFHKQSGELADNVGIVATRMDSRDSSLEELRESLRNWGWLEQFPMIVDEYGAILSGYRRHTIAKELGLPQPYPTLRLRCGDGTGGDVERFKIAIASNIGRKPLTARERQRLAGILYQGHEWTMQRIADALNVSQKTISKDLSSYTPGITPKSRGGRPRTTVTPEQEAEIAALHDAGMPRQKIQEVTSLGSTAVWGALQRHKGRTELAPGVPIGTPEQADSKCTCPNCGDIHSRVAADVEANS